MYIYTYSIYNIHLYMIRQVKFYTNLFIKKPPAIARGFHCYASRTPSITIPITQMPIIA